MPANDLAARPRLPPLSAQARNEQRENCCRTQWSLEHRRKDALIVLTARARLGEAQVSYSGRLYGHTAIVRRAVLFFRRFLREKNLFKAGHTCA